MLKKLIPIVLALVVMGAVTGVAAVMLLFLGQDWDDALFWVFASLMVISGLMVVTMRDIIRCGLAMIVCFGALAGIYVLMGATLIGAAQVIVYIGAISVLILFAIMLTQTKDAPDSARLPDAGRARRDRVGRDRRSSSRSRSPPRTGAGPRSAITYTANAGLHVPVQRLPAAVRDRQRAAARGRRRRGLPRQARTGRPLVSNSLDAYLILSGILFAIGTFGFLARRNAISMLMSIELMLNAVNLAIVAFGAFTPASGAQASVIALMVMAVAAGEATVGLAIVIAIYRNKKTPLVDEYDAMSR